MWKGLLRERERERERGDRREMREALKETPLGFICFNYYILDNVRDIYVLGI